MKHSLRFAAPAAVVLLIALLVWDLTPSHPVRAVFLRGYSAKPSTSFSTCANPQGVAFDGAHIWVSCHDADAIEELNPSDGKSLRIVTDNVKLATPEFLLYDGENIWVSNSSTSAGMLTKVRARDGAILNTYAVGSGPYGMTFDGTSVWVANYASNNLSKVNVVSGVVTHDIPLSNCHLPVAVGFDGAHIWVDCNNGIASGSVQELDLNGNWLHTVTVGSSPYNFAFDGTNIWVVNVLGNSISKIAAVATNSCPGPPCFVASYAVGRHPQGVAFDGKYIWVANATDATLTKLQASNGALAATIPVGSSPGAVAFDGHNIWATEGTANTVSKF